ncbi:MAG: PL29 family lyase N-terminal domain-containing protein, partial [Rikenellaceae bacterium]
MKKCFLLTLLAFSLMFSSCSTEYDDTDLINRIESIEAWITSLENDVQTIQTLIVALESNVAVSSVNETDDGYEIVFSNGQTITISDGISTEIAVIEVDGTFYWTLNGEPILDGNGNMIQASADTPYIKDGNWWIGSTDTGVQAQGNDGADGKDGQDGADGLNGQ